MTEGVIFGIAKALWGCHPLPEGGDRYYHAADSVMLLNKADASYCINLTVYYMNNAFNYELRTKKGGASSANIPGKGL